VLAIILAVEFGWRIGAAELIAEAVVCVAVIGGGGGGRLVRALRGIFARRRRAWPLPASS
jgi:hypothetical protein